MKLKDIFEKHGGTKLIQQYRKGGALGTAICEFLLLGKSRTGLEILREAAQLKVKQKLERKYRNVLSDFDQHYNDSEKHYSSKKVWICWFQGLEMAPKIVKKCVSSIKKNLPSKEIIIITDENIDQYVSFPDYIMEKFNSGLITKTHMTDLLRLELLTKYGGTWIDATVYCTQTEDTIPSYFFNSDLFFFQCLKPGRDAHSNYMSSWYINAKSHNKMLEATKCLCYEYWKTNDQLIDYFLLHDFMSIVLDYYPDDWNKIIPRDNATPHELLLRIFNSYDDDVWNAIIQQTPFHKLSYKFTEGQMELENTFYKRIVE